MAAALIVRTGDEAFLIPVEEIRQIGIVSVRKHAGLVIAHVKSLNQSFGVHLPRRVGSRGVLSNKLIIGQVSEAVNLHIERRQTLIVKPIVLLNFFILRGEDVETMVELILAHDLVVPGDELQVLSKHFVVLFGLRLVNGIARGRCRTGDQRIEEPL